MEFNCNNCGAEIKYEAKTQSLKCPYCGAVNEIKNETITESNSLPENIDKIVPLTVSKEEVEQRIFEYIASGTHIPDDMLVNTKIKSIEFQYVPAFDFTNFIVGGYNDKEDYSI